MSENDASGENTNGAISSVDLSSCLLVQSEHHAVSHSTSMSRLTSKRLAVHYLLIMQKARSATTRMDFKGMDTKATASEPFTGGTVIPPNPYIYIYNTVYIYTYLFIYTYIHLYTFIYLLLIYLINLLIYLSIYLIHGFICFPAQNTLPIATSPSFQRTCVPLSTISDFRYTLNEIYQTFSFCDKIHSIQDHATKEGKVSSHFPPPNDQNGWLERLWNCDPDDIPDKL